MKSTLNGGLRSKKLKRGMISTTYQLSPIFETVSRLHKISFLTVCVFCFKYFNIVLLFSYQVVSASAATPWTVAHHAALSL